MIVIDVNQSRITTAILPNLKGNPKLAIIRLPKSILNLSKLSNS